MIDVKTDRTAPGGSKKERLAGCVKEVEELLERASRVAANAAYMDKARGVRRDAVQIAIAQEEKANKAHDNLAVRSSTSRVGAVQLSLRPWIVSASHTG